MLDFRYIKDNIDAVKKNIADRYMEADADTVVRLYDERNGLIGRIEELRKKRNENAAKMKGKLEQSEREQLIQEGRGLKDSISSLENDLQQKEAELFQNAAQIPNMAHPDAPVGKEDKDNLEIKRSGSVPKFSFTPKDHLTLGTELDILDFDRAAEVSGPKFYYLKNEALFLDLALCRYALDLLRKKNFTVMLTPDIAKTDVVDGIGYNPRGAETNIYSLEGVDACLVGTAEITLGGYFMNKIIEEDALPVRFGGLSHCFRREAGAAGQYSKGLFRVHQFTKVEMFIFCRPEESEELHKEMLAIEEEIFSSLDIPYRVVDTCTGDLGAPAYRKYDLEAWMPGRGDGGDWGEITSTSNCTDYQARRLGIRYKSSDGGSGGTRYVHMLNGTAVAVSRALIAILENFQQADGSVTIPQKLTPYTGFERIGPKEA